MMPTAYEVLCDLVSELSARWHVLTEAAGATQNPDERARLLAIARRIEICDHAARKAVRDLRPTV